MAIKIARPREASVINTIFAAFLILGPVVSLGLIQTTCDNGSPPVKRRSHAFARFQYIRGQQSTSDVRFSWVHARVRNVTRRLKC